MNVKTFKDLIVWQKAHKLTLRIYKATKIFPKEEKFGIVSQIRRSSSAIPTNIVEGFKRRTTRDYLHFINIADASLEETKYLLLLAHDLGYLKDKEYKELLCDYEEISRMIGVLEKSLKHRL